MKRENSKKLDLILKILYQAKIDKEPMNPRALHKRIENLRIDEIKNHLYSLRKQGFINQIGNEVKYIEDGSFIELSTIGDYFLNNEGGFKLRYRQYLIRKSWTISKTIAAVANAILIILISIWAVRVAKKSANQQQNIESIQEEIIDLKNELKNILESQIKGDSTNIK